MSKTKRRTQTHHSSIYSDLTLWSVAEWVAECSCGWKSRPCSSPGVATGLFRRHAVVSGR